MPWISGGLALAGGLFGGNSAKKAAQAQADAQVKAAQIAADEARFRPVGVTTRFGQSQFQTDPTTGRVTGAGYTLTPEMKAMQDRFLGLAGQGLTQAEQAQQQFAPLQGAAQGLFGLGQQYLAQSPEEAAQQYMASQQNLLAPSRERQYGQLQNQLFQTGRGGLSVGATGEQSKNPPGNQHINKHLQKHIKLFLVLIHLPHLLVVAQKSINSLMPIPTRRITNAIPPISATISICSCSSCFCFFS